MILFCPIRVFTLRFAVRADAKRNDKDSFSQHNEEIVMTKTATIFAATFALILYGLTCLAPAYIAQVKHHQAVHAERLAQIEKF